MPQFPPALAIQQANDATPGTVPVIPAGDQVLVSTSDGSALGYRPLIQLTSVPIVSDATTARTFALGDAGKYFRFTSSSAVAATIPPNSSQAFPIGTVLEGIQAGSGIVSIVAGAGVTLFSKGYLTTLAPGSTWRARKVLTDTWDVSGDLGSTLVSPLVTMAGHVVQMFEAAVGLTTAGWTDQSGNGFSLGGGVNWLVGSDGVSSYAQMTGSQYKISTATGLVAPGTTPLVIDVIVQQDAYAAGGPLVAMGAGAACSVQQVTGAGTVKLYNGSSVSAAFAMSVFKRVRAIFTGATSGSADSITVGGLAAVTGFAGNSVPTGLYLGAANGSFFTGRVRAAYVYNSDPTQTAGKAAALDAYYASLYGAGILT